MNRSWRVTVGNTDVSNLSIEFEAMRSVKHEPNTLSLKIYNLAQATRSRLENATDDLLVQLRAGYDIGDSVIFVGDARTIMTEKDGPDFITTIEGRDGGRTYQRARINKSYPPGTPIRTAIVDAVDALGIGRGNVDDVDTFTLRGGATTFTDGGVSSGPAHRVLTSLLRGSGYRWSVQNNAMQILERGRPLQRQAVRLAPGTGLVGSPTKEDRGRVTATALMLPGLDPGRRIVLESALVSGGYEIERVVYSGQTRGNDWYAALELVPL